METMYNIKIKNYIQQWLVFLLVFIAFNFTNAQSVPDPIYTFPLDGNSPESWIDKNDIHHQGVKYGLIQPEEDRFGNPNGASFFNDHKTYVFQGDYFPQINAGVDVTVSFWTKLETAHRYPPSPTPYFPGTSQKHRYFTLAMDYKSGGLARSHNNALLGAERTVTANGVTKPWYFWLYKPAMLEQVGWYQIVAVMATNYTKIYVYKPDGTKACSYNYMANDFAKKIVIGRKNQYPSSEERVRPAFIMDDLKVWNTALSENQIAILHDQESASFNVDELSTYLIESKYSGFAHIYGNSLSNGGSLHTHSWVNQDNLKWYIQKAGKDTNGQIYYNIISKSSGKQVMVKNNATGNDGDINQYEAISNPVSNQWYIEYYEHDNQNRKIYRIKNKYSGKYMYVNEGSNPENISQWEWVNQSNLKWYVYLYKPEVKTQPDIADGTYRITNKNSGLLFGYGGISDSYQNYWKDNYTNFNVTYQGAGKYRLYMKNPLVNGYLAIKDNASTYSNNAQYRYLGANHFVDFYIREMGEDNLGKYFRIANAKTGKSATVYNDGTSNLDVINQYEWKNRNNQKWYFDRNEQPSINENVWYQIKPVNCPNCFLYNWNRGFSRSTEIVIFKDAPYFFTKSFRFIKKGVDLDGRAFYGINNAITYQSKYGNLQVSGGSSYDGADINVSDLYVDQDNLKWYIDLVRKDNNGKNIYRISSKLDGGVRSMEVSGNEYNNYQNVDITYWRNYYPNLIWYIEPVNNSLARNSQAKLLNTNLEELEDTNSYIFPNPIQNTLYVNLNIGFGQNEVNFNFYNLLGEKIFSENRKVDIGKQIVTLKNLKHHGFGENQMYILKITTSTGEQLLNTKVLFK
ncbi:MAG: RICIN domain-containing protein [Polaribacter sp.]